MHASINQNIIWEINILYKLENMYRVITKFIGILGLVLLLIILTPVLFIAFAVMVNLNNKKRLNKWTVEFAELTPEKKTEQYILIKEFNEKIVKKSLRKKSFFLLKKILKVFILFQEQIEKKHFQKIPQELLTPENSDIIDQMQEQFADGWEDDEMNVYDFTYAENEI